VGQAQEELLFCGQNAFNANSVNETPSSVSLQNREE
jgi:hypothetical protein